MAGLFGKPPAPPPPKPPAPMPSWTEMPTLPVFLLVRRKLPEAKSNVAVTPAEELLILFKSAWMLSVPEL